MKNKHFFIISLAISLIFLATLFYFTANQQEPSIGGQRDAHGCLGPAGYSWNETDQLCVREWTREQCPEEPGEFCTTVYEPVCGLPDKKQYSNSCFACLNTQNTYFIDGECE